MIEARDFAAALIDADRRFTVFEFALHHLLSDHLRRDAVKAVAVKYYKFDGLVAELDSQLADGNEQTDANVNLRTGWK